MLESVFRGLEGHRHVEDRLAVLHGDDAARVPRGAARQLQRAGQRLQLRCQIAGPQDSAIGMAQEEAKIGSFREFTAGILPRIVKSGYNTIQLMAVQEHPYYGSFGYHVSSFFAPSSRFGTPEDLMALVDAAHQRGIAVIMDLVHSHAVANTVEGLGRFDGTEYQYFHQGPRGYHHAWDSRCFDYGKPEVQELSGETPVSVLPQTLIRWGDLIRRLPEVDD